MKYLIGFFPAGKHIPMKNSAQHIIEILFGREKLEDVTVNQLKDLVKEYPSFNIGHYLLSKKLQAENHEEFLPETKKTALYINNPFWLQWLLQQVNDEPIIYPHAGQQFVHPKGTGSYIYTEEQGDLSVKPAISVHREQSEELQPESAPIEQETILSSVETANFQPTEQLAEETLEAPVFEQPEPILEETPETSEFELAENLAEESLEPTLAEQPQQIVEETLQTTVFEQPENSSLEPTVSEQPEQIVEETLETTVFEFEQTENLVEESLEPPVFEQPEQIVDQPVEPAHFDQSNPEIVQPQETDIHDLSEQYVTTAEDSEDKKAMTEEILPESIVSSETSPGAVNEQSSDQPAFVSENRVIPPVKIEVPKLEEIAFDPYHTIDYFASQGIKFVQDENPSDKLGKQLKSFTDWLKIMKRLPQKAFEEITDETREADVEIIAAHSIEEKDVVTEAMATVLAKQGKNEKAIETYQKLSLLDPGKSHYFATKIEELKIHPS